MDARPTPAYTSRQVRAAERPHLDADEPLMLRAAAALAQVISSGTGSSDRLLILAGSGDNGGDALFAAARLASAGHPVSIVACGSRIHEEALLAAQQAGAVVRIAPSDIEPSPADLDTVTRAAAACDLVVDGILGTGSAANPALRPRARAIAAAVREAMPPRARVVAVDLPSGIHPDTGAAPEPVLLAADTTVTFGGLKAGLVRGAGRRASGRIVLVDIGISDELAHEHAELVTDEPIDHLDARNILDEPAPVGTPTRTRS